MSMNGQAVDASLGSNPLREGLAFQGAPPGHTLIIFGGSGDLAARKLIPRPLQPGTQRPPLVLARGRRLGAATHGP